MRRTGPVNRVCMIAAIVASGVGLVLSAPARAAFGAGPALAAPAGAAFGAGPVPSAPARATYPAAPVVGTAVRVSAGRACSGQNAEVETATNSLTGVLYEEWIGCRGIGFASSADGGRTFSASRQLPGSAGGWDPAIAVGPHGAVYAAFMVFRATRAYPVVDISSDHGRTFPAVRPLVPPRADNWGDRDFIAIGPRGAIFVTWDYGPHRLTGKDIVCSPSGSCSFVAGDINVVVQRSTDHGRTWSKIIPISPGFPGSGADSAPILVEPDGRLDVLYIAHKIVDRSTLKLGAAHNFFTTSTDNGRTWSKPRRLGPARLSMNNFEWWIDGSLGMDSAGNLYATWDTQSGGHDIGWLAYSTDGGSRWSPLFRVTRQSFPAMRMVQVLGGGPRIAYVGLLTNGVRCGGAPCYGQYLRVFSIGRGWLTPFVRVSRRFGNGAVWPGDTFGLSLLPGGAPGHERLAVSWGSAIGGPDSQIRAAVVRRLP
jgi:BNR repeat protein